MIAVVTGASGFVGQNLVRRLKEDGHDVRCLVRPMGGNPPAGVQRFPVRYDQPKSLLECKALEGADVVFHLAAATKAVGEPAFTAANVTPTRHLLGALIARRLFPRFVYVSSQAAAGPAPALKRPLDEDDPPRPVEAYGRSKLEAERIVRAFADRVPVTIVRPASVFGPFDRDFLPLFRFAQRGVIVYPGIARQWVSLLYVNDLVHALIAAATRPEAIARTYFLASEEPVEWRAFGEHVATAVAADKRVRHVNVPLPAVRAAAAVGDGLALLTRRVGLANHSKAALAAQPYWVCSASRARSDLGLSESLSLPDAVRRTYYWYLKSGWLRGSSRVGGVTH